MIPLESLSWSSLPLAAQIALVLVVLAEVVLLAMALVHWARTPEDRFSANRWIWLAVIFLFQGVGPVVFLLFGRRPPTVDVGRRPAGDADSTLDMLYGKRDG